MRRSLALLFGALFMLAGLAACDDPAGGGGDQQQPPPAPQSQPQ